MKKIFTLICALTAVFTTAQAQDVVFTYGGETLQEGAEVTVQAEDWTDMGMGYIADSNTPKVLELKNTGAGSAMVSVTVKVIAGEYADIMWCGITTQCQKMASQSETRSTTLAAGATARLNIDTDFEEGEYGVRSVLVTATANGESTSMTFHMENKEAGATVVATKTYTDNLIVSINEASSEPMEANIVLDEMSDGTYTLSLKNFALVDGENEIPVGNITLPGITLTEGQGCKEFATKQIIAIQPGETGAAEDWIGPMLGDVPIDMQGQLTAEKLYCTIDIDMMESLQQIIKVAFGEELTGIAAVQGNAARVNVYGIDGRIVRSNVSAADALNGLPRGIYVVGGKKVLK